MIREDSLRDPVVKIAPGLPSLAQNGPAERPQRHPLLEEKRK